MLPDPAVANLLARLPLARDIRFSVLDDPRGDVLPSISLLLAAGECREPGATCFVYPRARNIAIATCVIEALSRLKDEFPSLLEEYARRGFERGERVCVL